MIEKYIETISDPQFVEEKPKESTHSSLIDIFIQKATEYPDHPAITTTERTINYRELTEKAQSLAVHLYKIGVQHETPVAILLEPGIEYARQ
ncbi:AMP-binding protein [Photorhabdus sp. APURE]|uniref:AMP-binding protein n=1 Tax=Photorhabdus aballayi TaxID=2991723 RepID=UPI00223CAEDE|nr:AMP-binding protein [Photorhabdus aballayi]MCW7548073.1 AMP-binding protein [Photorhabdus aballayi]